MFYWILISLKLKWIILNNCLKAKKNPEIMIITDYQNGYFWK